MAIGGRVLRGTVLRSGRHWRVPWGIARGVRMVVTDGTPLHEYLGTTEIEIAGHIRRLATPGTRCFDIGGEVGYYALVLAKLTQARVATFEFRDMEIGRIRDNLALNPAIGGRVTVVKAYVAEQHVDEPRAETIDDLVRADDLFAPGLLKIDVEGAEANVLRGAREYLRSARPHLVIETHSADLEGDCLALLRDVGYEPLIVEQRTWLREHRGRGHNRWLVAQGDVTVSRS
jgi:FkbM family methyltransferase